jgi:hypothetical protein
VRIQYVAIIYDDAYFCRDMKAALQEAEDAEEDEEGGGGDGQGSGAKRLRDAKGREILSDEEKAKKEEKRRQKAAEVR